MLSVTLKFAHYIRGSWESGGFRDVVGDNAGIPRTLSVTSLKSRREVCHQKTLEEPSRVVRKFLLMGSQPSEKKHFLDPKLNRYTMQDRHYRL
jgi:hypothetical protein